MLLLLEIILLKSIYFFPVISSLSGEKACNLWYLQLDFISSFNRTIFWCYSHSFTFACTLTLTLTHTDMRAYASIAQSRLFMLSINVNSWKLLYPFSLFHSLKLCAYPSLLFGCITDYNYSYGRLFGKILHSKLWKLFFKALIVYK